MVLFNHATREMTAKIVYYGPGLGGKTTNLLVIYDMLDSKTKGKMLSLATRSDRTLFFDLLPVDIGKLGNFNLKIQLYTVPGQVFYNETRKLVLRGADSIVFVADSQLSMLDSNRESFLNLLENLRENHIDPERIPIIVQFNKRDIPGALSIDEMRAHIGVEQYQFMEASALKGEGVMETFRLVSKTTAKHLLDRMKGKKAPAEQINEEATVNPQPEAAAEPLSERSEAASPPPHENTFVEDSGVEDTLIEESAEESAPFETDYDRMEEVSLDELLEGRDRPLTLSGNVPLPYGSEDDVEELLSGDLFEDSSSPDLAGNVENDSLPALSDEALGGELQQEIEFLHSQIAQLQSEHQETLDTIARTLQELTNLIRSRIGTS